MVSRIIRAGLSFEINRLESVFAVFARKIVQRYATVSQNLLNPKSSFLAAFSRHYFGAKNHRHFRSRPNIGGENFLFIGF